MRPTLPRQLTRSPRLILTPTSSTPRAIFPSMRSLPAWSCPSSLLPIALLHSTIPSFIMTSTPLFLRSNLRVDPVLTPAAYSICTFLSATAELFVKLPLETILRRGQIHVLQRHAECKAVTFNAPQPCSSRIDSFTAQQYTTIRAAPRQQPHSHPEPLRTVVETAPYHGILGTAYSIVYEEGYPTPSATAAATHAAAVAQKSGGVTPQRQQPAMIKKGQGIKGLWRGWRVGLWGLIGVWGAAAMGGTGGGKGGEF